MSKSEILADKDRRRLDKLECILGVLEENERVQNRQLKCWLTDDEFEQLEAESKEQKQYREELKEKPTELKRYEEKLKKAMFYENKAEGSRGKGNKQVVATICAEYESLCEDA